MARRRYAVARRATRARGPSPALKKAKAALARSRASARKLRAQAKGAGGVLETSLSVTGGGAAAGAVTAYLPAIGPVDTRAVIGTLAVAAGAFGLSGKAQCYAVNAGAGMLATFAHDMVADLLVAADDDDSDTTEES